MTDISKARVLMIATDGYEEAELFSTRRALLDGGAEVTLASINKKPISGVRWDDAEQSSYASQQSITPDLSFDEVKVEEFDALVLPGGVTNPDTLRIFPDAIAIIRQFNDAAKLVAALCHAPWLLIEADIVDGRRATGWFSVRTDLTNAGAQVVDEEVVVDGNLITSRMPADVPAFTAAVIEALAAKTNASD
jgi:protease I